MPEKPIEEVRDTLSEIMRDIKSIKTEINHIKEYTRKIEIRKQIEDEEYKKLDSEYVKPSKSWFW
jgi:chromosome segregation ATPase